MLNWIANKLTQGFNFVGEKLSQGYNYVRNSLNSFLNSSRNQAVQQYEYTSTVNKSCLLYTSPSPRDRQKSRMPSSA